MELDEARDILRTVAANAGLQRLAIAAEVVLARLDGLDRRAQQVRGGLKPYARPVEIVDFLMGEQA